MSQIPDFNQADPIETIDPYATGDLVDGGVGPIETAIQNSVPSSAKGTDTFAPEDQQRLVEICQRFRDAWDAGPEPQVLAFLPRGDDRSLREYLAVQLVMIDVEKRAELSRPLATDAYLSQLPECRVAIQSALTRRYETGPRSRVSGTNPVSGVAQASNAVGHGKKPELEWIIDAEDAQSLRYHPVKMHARGGLGAVFRAKDRELGRTVALKRMLPEVARSAACKQRFIFEAEVTGSLEHPGIVPVYGLGSYGNGQPYYAMRFIRGNSFKSEIVDFYETNPSPAKAFFDGRDFRQWLRRLIDCCDAMQYAHEHGVLHRDLKPDNIMLGRHGETLVVDWGLAKVREPLASTDSGLSVAETTVHSSSNALHTSQGMTLGTPMYMSPEQAKGLHNELTPASDVYSLGAILFNIASGQYPIQGKRGREVLQNVIGGQVRDLCDVMPTAPRAIASICRKAMAYSPTDRYATATAMAEDIDRWMNDELPIAHTNRELAFEKAGRLIRRYRSWTIATAVALVAITLISLLSAVMIQRAKRNEEIAKLRAQQFKSEAVARYRDSRQAIDTWLVQSSDSLQYLPATQSIRRRLLKIASEDYAKLAKSVSDDPELELERGRALARLGDLTQLQGDHDAARAEYDEAIKLFNLHLDDASRRQQSDSLNNRYVAELGSARARIALAFANQDRLEEAEAEFKQAIDLLDDLAAGEDDSADDAKRYLASTLVNSAELEILRGNFAIAEARLESSQQTIEKLGARILPNDQLVMAQADELSGRLVADLGDHIRAIELFGSAATRVEPLAERFPDVPDYLDAIASLRISQASSYRARGLLAEGQAALAEAAKHYRALCSSLPDVPMFRESLILSLTDSALASIDIDRFDDAKPILQEAATRAKDLVDSFPTTPNYQGHLAAIRDAQGQTALAMGDFDSAQTYLADCITIYQRLTDDYLDQLEYSQRLAIAQSHYSQVLAEIANRSTGAQRDDAIGQATQGFLAAAETLQTLVDVSPATPAFASSLAHVQFHRGRFLFEHDLAQSIEAFQLARDAWVGLDENRQPSDNERLAWMLTTVPVDELRDPILAVRYASAACQSAADNFQFRCTLALAQAIAGETNEANKTLALGRASTQANTATRIWFVKAIVKKIAGDADAAAIDWASAIQSAEVHGPAAPDFVILKELFEQPVQSK